MTHKLVKAAEFTTFITPRTCSRCGERFGALGREHVCRPCRKPKVRARPVRAQCLSFREKQVIGMIQQAKMNKEIAFELCLTEGTVKEYMHNIFQKVGVKNRTELALWSYTHKSEKK